MRSTHSNRAMAEAVERFAHITPFKSFLKKVSNRFYSISYSTLNELKKWYKIKSTRLENSII